MISTAGESRPGIMRRWRLALAVAVVVLAGGGIAFALYGGASEYDNVAWKRVEPGGDCQCANGSEFAFWERRADPKKVVVFLNGGDVCWDATACAFTDREDGWDWDMKGEGPDNRTQEGFFDFGDGDNPFADHSASS